MITTWLLTGHKAGDNTQMRALAKALAFKTRELPMRYTPWELMVTLSGSASLASIERESRMQLQPPWPNLVLTAGRRNEAAALHIRKASGGSTKIVHLGRPWHQPGRFDLVLFSTSYRLEAGAALVELELPLKPEIARRQATSRFEHLPRPHIALLIGGNSGALTLDDRHSERLLRRASALARSLSASLLISTSARTPAAVNRHLEHVDVPHCVWRWGEPDNPYVAFLASADALIITGDSASMLSEALALAKPVLVFDFADGNWWRHLSSYRPNALVHRLAMRLAPMRLRRDSGRVHRRLIEAGHAAWLVDGLDRLPQCVPYENKDLQRATEAVRQLLGVD